MSAYVTFGRFLGRFRMTDDNDPIEVARCRRDATCLAVLALVVGVALLMCILMTRPSPKETGPSHRPVAQVSRAALVEHAAAV